MKNVNERAYAAFRQSGCAEKLSAHIGEIIEILEQDYLVNLAYEKSLRISLLHDAFAGVRPGKLFLLKEDVNLGLLSPKIAGVEVQHLDSHFFNIANETDFTSKAALIRGGVIITTNNDVNRCGLENYLRFYLACDKTIFVTWDFDNHHWLQLSAFLAAMSDIYVPAQRDNLYPLSKLNPYITPVVNCGVVQWEEAFIRKWVDFLANCERSDEPLGRHTPYSRFRFRQKVMLRLNEIFPEVGSANPRFHFTTQEEKLRQWAGHKAQWIIPTLGDVPIRLGDALITGGIPVMPVAQRYLLDYPGMSGDWIAFYSIKDLIDDPRVVAKMANSLFDLGGKQGIINRIEYGLSHFHGNSQLSRIWDFMCERIGVL